MELSGRLKLIYQMIPQCGTLCDVGADHALIPAYALLNNRCRKAVACDVKKGPLERADRTLLKYGLQDCMDLRLGSGLRPISADEADVVILAGMGGVLIAELLNDQLEKAKLAHRIILQPMYAQEVIRPFLWRNGFRIEDEALTREGSKIYQAMAVSFDKDATDKSQRNPLFEVVGELLIKKKDPLLNDWLYDRIEIQKKIVNGLRRAAAPSPSLKREEMLLIDMEALLGT